MFEIATDDNIDTLEERQNGNDENGHVLETNFFVKSAQHFLVEVHCALSS